jgi:purine-nucleoside phosphorylase
MSRKNLVQTIQNATGTQPVDMGLILGSGLGDFADQIDGTAISYDDLDGFPHAGVSGHNPKLVIGQLGSKRVAIFGARSHYYEHGKADAMRLPLEVLADLGADTLFATNAAGALSTDLAPGDLMMLNDHINFSGLNPLIGEPTDRRFTNMTNAYDVDLRAQLVDAAKSESVELNQGVYAWYSGPSFETPAEIRALGILGADAVGMSTVPEVILARFLGLKAAAISTITNMAAGIGTEHISHEHTKEMAPIGAAKLARILKRFCA